MTLLKNEDQAEENGKKTVLLSLNLPYDAACYENTDAVLCAYQPYGSAYDENGNGPFNLNVAAALCTAFGQSVPSGNNTRDQQGTAGNLRKPEFVE